MKYTTGNILTNVHDTLFDFFKPYWVYLANVLQYVLIFTWFWLLTASRFLKQKV